MNLPTGLLTTITPEAQWTWNTAGSFPVVTTYPSGTPTKTGLMPTDLDNFVGVPLVFRGNPSRPMLADQKVEILRQSEDWVEQETGLLLAFTWVASPPTRNSYETSINGMSTPSGQQVLGVDYDLSDAAYDFNFTNSQDNGWMIQPLRYRPVRKINGMDYSALKNYAYEYPLLDMFFRVPPTWFVVDEDFGLVRLVPAANIQMLPLFALQLAFGGFSENLPGALWLQYTAGLQPNDYNTRFRFMHSLVLSAASMIALRTISGSINAGLVKTAVLTDGVQTQFDWGVKGPYAAQIDMFKAQRDELMETALNKVSGPSIVML